MRLESKVRCLLFCLLLTVSAIGGLGCTILGGSSEGSSEDVIQLGDSWAPEEKEGLTPVNELDFPCDVSNLAPGIDLELLRDLGLYHLDLVNADRAYFEAESDGATALVWNDTLWVVALCHAQDMCQRDYFSHYSPEGDDVGDRIEEVTTQSKWSWGENLAYSWSSWINNQSGFDVFLTVVAVHHNGYMDECQCTEGCASGKIAGHRTNILNPDFTDVGIGEWYCEEDGAMFNTQVFWRTDLGKAKSNPYCSNGFTADPPEPWTTAP
jgi:hypothetical protein